MCILGADAVCMAVLTIAALAWEGTENAKRADNAVIIIQLMVLVGKALPKNVCGYLCAPLRYLKTRTGVYPDGVERVRGAAGFDA